MSQTSPVTESARQCTCHPDDLPPTPCARKYALSECEAHERLRRFVDIVWLHATENASWPSTTTIDSLIEQWQRKTKQTARVAKTPDLEATVSRIMVIRNGMILDGDAEALIRKEIGALMGSHVQNSKQWQPIETAPKGVRLLLFSPGHKISDDPDERAVIITSTTRDWNWATHWMPLPAPPTLSDTSTDRTSKCTWPDCEQPSGHDLCHRHCLDNAGHPANSSRGDR
jgi:hypothetical protein